MEMKLQGKFKWLNCAMWFDFLTYSNVTFNSRSDDVNFFALATRDDDMLFSSFVNVVVAATLYADENGIQDATGMPLMSIFGDQFSWALRDAFVFSESYDSLYKDNFGSQAARGRNALNDGGPEMHSFPGLSD